MLCVTSRICRRLSQPTVFHDLTSFSTDTFLRNSTTRRSTKVRILTFSLVFNVASVRPPGDHQRNRPRNCRSSRSFWYYWRFKFANSFSCLLSVMLKLLLLLLPFWPAFPSSWCASSTPSALGSISARYASSTQRLATPPLSLPSPASH